MLFKNKFYIYLNMLNKRKVNFENEDRRSFTFNGFNFNENTEN